MEFDTISHASLLQKLPSYGIKSTELIWFRDYLNDTLNAEIVNIKRFLTDNELIVNLKKGKTEAMFFSTAKKLNESDKLELLYGNTPKH